MLPGRLRLEGGPRLPAHRDRGVRSPNTGAPMPSLVIQLAMGASLLFPTRSGGMLPEGLCHATPRPPAKEGGLVTEERRVGDLGKWGGRWREEQVPNWKPCEKGRL